MKIQCSPPKITDILHNTCSNPPHPGMNAPVRSNFAVKIRLDTIMTLSARFELEAAISDSLSMISGRACIITFAYELDNLVHECNDDIDGHFNVVYCFIQTTSFEAEHQEILDLRNRLPHNKSIVVNGTTSMIQYFHYETDPSFIANEKTWLLHQEPRRIHNPYSNATVILFPLSECYNSAEDGRMYTIAHMECPSILLPLQMFDVERKEHGLYVKKTNTNVPFSEFRSFNSTHVYVCQETLLAMKVASVARILKPLNSCILTIVVFITFH